ncbi:BsuBI/PstI family type II restriction endonuclease [Actinokineospora cianjurensis]|uniref:Type II restriction enzyme n=1 Tax=Actinokineospora cianjurensis TaxID=585224 RepID=A0A421AXI5_9PSEU|nr:BsuBI/PstI family type II restriction endonuclease [Actinokineospora cianjurensis]RLK54567.1 type II restriction enzyme [Actinokineospora cianjurensis]
MNDVAYDQVEHARIVLESLGFDKERSNERSARVLLALLQLKPGDSWSSATAPLLGTRAIMDWIRDEYGVDYKPNTRETIRRSTLHQFAEVALVEQNPDQPDRAINSPKWCYAIPPRVLKVLQAYGTGQFYELVAQYLREQPGLISQYAAARSLERIPVALPDGRPITLSPGGQNRLIKKMIDEFCERFTPGGQVLYVGDADAKWAFFDEKSLVELGVVVDQHGKMPDLVVYFTAKNWLVLMEAADSHGPVDAKRHRELATLFGQSSAGLVYVSCFPDRQTMRKYLNQIAWETEAWCADNPTHLIHFNGERFLGPYGVTK